jgi:hypothetical protein
VLGGTAAERESVQGEQRLPKSIDPMNPHRLALAK